jgi:hypothetical protein
MQMSIVSTYGNLDLANVILSSNEKLNNLAHEFCTTFNVKVTNHGKSENKLDVVNNNGIPLGALYTESDGSDTIYIFESDRIIKKSRSSKYTSNSARDSKKISTLIKSIKKNNEEPIVSKLFPEWGRTIRYGFHTLKPDNATRRVEMPRDQFQFICEHVLGENVSGIIDYNLLKESLTKMRNEEKECDEKLKEYHRFTKGVTAIKMPLGSDKHYVVLKARYDLIKSETEILSEPVRYESMSDTEFAGLALMCRSRKNDNHFTATNEFGIDRRDYYWEDLDIATCYNGDLSFVIIPDNIE